MLLTSLAIIAGILLIAAIILLTENFFQIEAQKAGIDTKTTNMGLMPTSSKLLGNSAPSGVSKSNFHKLSKGYDIKLVGEAQGDTKAVRTSRYAVKPMNYRGIAPIPKLTVDIGDEVKAGDVVFFDKSNPDIKFVSPVSGEVVEIRRAEKRAISHIVILADKEDKYKDFNVPNLSKTNREALIKFLMESGFWPHINKRPFDSIANPNTSPRDIFISTFDTAPLAPNESVVFDSNYEAFNKGLEALGMLTDGKVHLGIRTGTSLDLEKIDNNDTIEHHYFSGPHPSGNVGVQIHHIKPLGSSDSVWTLKPNDVILLGRLLTDGKFDSSRTIAITGGGIKEPKHVQLKIGTDLNELLEADILSDNYRVINGDVLSGKKVAKDDFSDAFISQITTLEEGNQFELLGWLLPLSPRPSISGTFPNRLFKNHRFEATTNTRGERRAFVMTGQYESLLPMDIYPQHLLKAIMTNDYERMEGLGIYELTEEDLALCEFACTSKMPLQSILRQGLNMMEEQS